MFFVSFLCEFSIVVYISMERTVVTPVNSVMVHRFLFGVVGDEGGKVGLRGEFQPA